MPAGASTRLLMRGIDMVMAFPYILLALAIVAVLGPGLLNALYAIAVVNIPFFARNIRGITLGLSRREFVDAARLSGKSNAQILFGEMLPNVLPVIIITMSTTIGWMILETAGLSFLGLGAQPPQADLGSMLGDGRKILFTAPHVSIIPGLMIFALVMSINLLGDGVRDVLDPRLKSGALTRPVARTAVDARARAADRRAGAGRCPRRARPAHRIPHRRRRSTRRSAASTCMCGRASAWASSANPVPASRLRPCRSWGWCRRRPGASSAAPRLLDGEDLFAATDERIRQLRGAAVSHVFQDPLSTLHPLFTVGDQLDRGDPGASAAVEGAKRRAKAAALLEHGAHPESGGAAEGLSARIVRRHAPARLHRHGARQRCQDHHRRRADDGARRDCAGAGAVAARRAAHGSETPASCSSPMISASSRRSATASR